MSSAVDRISRVSGLIALNIDINEVVFANRHTEDSVAYSMVITSPHNKRDYSAVAVGARTLKEAMENAWRMRVPFVLICEWRDSIGLLIVTRHLWDAKIQNEVISFPVEEFIRVKA